MLLQGSDCRVQIGNRLISIMFSRILASSPRMKAKKIFPAPKTHAYNHPVPQRIHRQACRRCGAGSGDEDRRKASSSGSAKLESPSGDTGGEDARRTSARPLRNTQRRAGRACVAHKGKTGSGSHRRCPPAGSKEPVGTAMANGPIRSSSQRDPTRGQKRPNGALRGATYTTNTRQLSAPRPIHACSGKV